MTKILLQILYTILFGILTVIVGALSGFIVQKTSNTVVPRECADWNKNRVMEKSLFLTGIILYFVIVFIKKN